MDSFPLPEPAIAKKRRRATNQKAPDGQARRPSAFPRSYWLVVLPGIIPSVLALAHTPGVNGPYYWKWGYHDGPFAAYAGLALVAAGILYWVHDQAESDRSMRKALIAAPAVHLLLTFGYIGFAPNSFGNIAGRVEHPDINSYHSEAQRTGDLGEWLETFPERVPDFLLHAKTHPPGPADSLLRVLERSARARVGRVGRRCFAGIAGGLDGPSAFSSRSRGLRLV